jgi:hypothetical protein
MITINFSLEWTEDRLSDREVSPQVKCYLDGRFDRDVTIVRLKKIGEVVRGAVSGKSRLDISPDCSICFVLMAWNGNEYGTPCLTDKGVDSVSFGEVQTSFTRNRRFEKILTFTMHTVGNLVKGKAKLTITEWNVPKLQMSLNESIRQQPLGAVASFIETVMSIEQRFPERFRGTENMRVPYDYSEASFQSTGGNPLPALTFALAEIPRSNLTYWQNAFKTVMARDDLKPEDWSRLNKRGKTRVLQMMICYQPQYTDYISDLVDRNIKGRAYQSELVSGCENFGTNSDSGDCEDVGNQNMTDSEAFSQQEIPVNSVYSEQLKEMQEINRGIVPVLSLDVVRGAQVHDETESYGAHMNVNFIPIGLFEKWVGRTKLGREFLQTINSDNSDNSDVHFGIGEGTGMCDSMGYDTSPLAKCIQTVYSLPSLRYFKTPIQPNVKTGFFVGSLVGVTNYFGRPIGLWYGTKGPDGTVQRGQTYEEMMKDSDQVVLIPQPEPSKEVLQVMTEANYKRLPPKPLILSSLDPPERRKKHSILENLVKTVDSWHRGPGPRHSRVPVYVRPHQLTQQIGREILADFQRTKEIWKVEYSLEQITDDTWGYRVLVFSK